MNMSNLLEDLGVLCKCQCLVEIGWEDWIIFMLK